MTEFISGKIEPTKKEKIKRFFQSFTSKRGLGILTTLLLVITLPLLIFIAQQPQQIKQRAASIPTQSSPSVFFGITTSHVAPTYISLFQFEHDAGKKVAIDHQYLGTTLGNFANVPNANRPTCATDSNWIFPISIHKPGDLYSFGFSFDPSKPPGDYDSWSPPGIRELGMIPMLTVISENILKSDPQINSDYKTCWTKLADQALNWGKPFFLEIDHEMNGGWYGLGASVNTNGTGSGSRKIVSSDFVAMWKHIHDLFTSEAKRLGKPNNATFVWCPNTFEKYDAKNLQDLHDLYPGDSYVDWTCLDGYGPRNFSDVMKPFYDEITAKIAPSKPMMIGEYSTFESSDPNTKSNWYKDTLMVQIPNNFPKIKAIVLFNNKYCSDGTIKSDTCKNGQSPLDSRIETSGNSISGFKQGINFSKNGSPFYEGSTNNYRNIECSTGWCPIPGKPLSQNPYTIGGAVWYDPNNTCSKTTLSDAWNDGGKNSFLGVTFTRDYVQHDYNYNTITRYNGTYVWYDKIGYRQDKHDGFTTYDLDVSQGTYKVGLSNLPQGYKLSDNPSACSANSNNRVVTVPNSSYHTDFFITPIKHSVSGYILAADANGTCNTNGTTTGGQFRGDTSTLKIITDSEEEYPDFRGKVHISHQATISSPDKNGNVSFSIPNLPNGTYTLNITPPASYELTTCRPNNFQATIKDSDNTSAGFWLKPIGLTGTLSSLQSTTNNTISTTVNQKLTFNAIMSTTAIKNTNIYVEKSDASSATSWGCTGTIMSNKWCLLGTNSNTSLSTTWTPTKPGNYYVAIIAYGTNGKQCSGDPLYIGKYPIFGYDFCGDKSYITVNVN